MQMVEFHVHYEENELYIYQRLETRETMWKGRKRLMIIRVVFMQKFTMRVNWCMDQDFYMSDHRNSIFQIRY